MYRKRTLVNANVLFSRLCFTWKRICKIEQFCDVSETTSALLVLYLNCVFLKKKIGKLPVRIQHTCNNTYDFSLLFFGKHSINPPCASVFNT